MLQYARHSTAPGLRHRNATTKSDRNLVYARLGLITKQSYHHFGSGVVIIVTVSCVCLDVKPKIDDIAVLHDIFLALEAGEAFFAGGFSAAAGN